MRSFAFFAALFVPLVASLPVRRQAAANSSDLLVLQFANVLEQLETTFYTQALAQFQDSDFTAAGFTSAQLAIQQFQSIMSDEATHVTVLASAIQSLGDTAISGCSFDFSSVLTDVSIMASTARVVENTGVGAYLGAAGLLTDPSLLTAAASILTVEARHQTILNVLNDGTAIPNAFDLPLLPQEVLAIAGGFISGCETGIEALPALQITNAGTVTTGTSLTFSAETISADVDPSTLTCQMLTGGMPFSLTLPFNACVVPPNINGPVAIWVTNNSQPLNNNARDRFLGDVVAGPTMAFIDIDPEMLGQLTRTEGGSSGSVSVTTTTISPADATSLAASASVALATASASPVSGAQAVAQPGGPNVATGLSEDNSIDVLGWSSVSAANS